MRLQRALSALGLIGLILLPSTVMAQTLKVSGLPVGAVDLPVVAIEAAGLTDIKDSRQISVGGTTETRDIVYQGALLPRLLDKAGLAQIDRYKVRSAVITVIAKDGYQAVFSWGELFNSPVGDRVLVILRENGAHSAREGSFSLRSFGDLRPGPRHVRDVAEIRISPP